MALKTPMKVRRLSEFGYAAVDMEVQGTSAALRGLAHWLDAHPYVTLLGINLNYGATDEETYMNVFLDCVEDSDLS